MIRPVLKRSNPMLLESALEATNIDETKEVIGDLWDTLDSVHKLYDFTRGSGMAAPQIGRLLRIAVVEYEDERYNLVNPVITARSEEQFRSSEGCPSFFNYRGITLRAAEVTVVATDETGHHYSVNASQQLAVHFQHEIDHLDGQLYNSRLAPGEELIEIKGLPEIP